MASSQEEEHKDENAFGTDTYWNRPPENRRGRTGSKDYSPLQFHGDESKREKSKSPKRPTSPTDAIPAFSTMMSSSGNASGTASTTRRRAHSPPKTIPKTQQEEDDEKDEKSFLKLVKNVLPQFSDESDWEMAIFELTLILERVWPHKDKLNIKSYMTQARYYVSNRDMENRADRLIYFALTVSAKKDSFAKLQIMAASHPESVPCVMANEGKKLYEMFQASFSMTNLHEASLPTVRQEFYAIKQKEGETVLKYASRVDVIVATLSKLHESVSTGAWIYAL